ncbi:MULTISPECIES: PAC2 family protein [unclassified Gordonia (in: high G+C Gram-positive bacteria)]|uniref:PAC2 family protein n=1 Tax=unclassified Gordonia (in: high G+C Gram-positive bacteria) TaxID=2657482 RepID=UPI001F0E3689|nr:PAC2 family protein [Gordonia sp. ABSL49_1]MCH5642504.1 PAC2 family protein [Gordonia sp. ABSL49_1]
MDERQERKDQHGDGAPGPDDTANALYELAFPAPQLGTGDTGPVLIHALEGFADAGHAVALAATHLRDSLESELVATFTSDELMDYRSRRPTISFSGETFTDVQMPELTIHAIRDTNGKGFLLLSGSEPDLRWEQFVDAVRRLSDHFGVTDVVGLNAIPMAVPHTRPPSITAHGSDPDALGDLPRWGSAMKLPASASMLLELRMGQHDYRAAGLSVHVPHYLAQTNYPAASARLLTAVTELTGLQLPIAALQSAAEKVRDQIDNEVSGNSEIESVVAALETQYDSFTQAQEERASLLAAEESLPSGDELGAELERFLAEQAGTDHGNLDTDSDDGNEGPRSPM